MYANNRMSHWLIERLIIAGLMVVIVIIITVFGTRANRKKLRSITDDRKLMDELRQMRKRGDNYQQMSKFLVSKGIESHIADTIIARLETPE